METQVKFNGQDYIAIYNKQTGYYEIELAAPDVGGIYPADIKFTDLFDERYEDSINIQILIKERLKLETNKNFIWIFDYKDFSVKEIIELSDYELNIDEETNANSIIKILKKTSAKSNDIVVFKKNNEVLYWGIIDNIQNQNGENIYQFITKYITNLFNRNIILENENLIRTTGVEDFIANAITKNFINNQDTFINLNWLDIKVKTHTKKDVSVSNVENGIYNLHTWMTNCTQNYDIVYSFSIIDKKLVMTIENKALEKQIIDTKAQPISNYSEVFEIDVVSKVIVKTSNGIYTLYLKNDRTTTENMNDPNRVEGRIETIYTEKFEDAKQVALNVMKTNSYNHNITFDYLERYIKVGTPIAIKTKESLIFDSYISAIKITQNRFIKYTCGNIRVNFIDKLLKERRN